ncbi:MAG: DUF4366 domain-containing protein [Alistipes sp.]|nr:DUF4366 domain-containing protein [Alistipes sp.]
MKAKFFSAVLSAAVLAMASVGVTASAEEAATEETAQTTESTTEMQASENTAEMVEESSAESTTIDYFADDYYDTEGNASLIKSEQIIYNSEEMQFIAVTTKDGHVFYVLINYSVADGQDNVYFLNKVDDYDLYALLYAGEENESNGTITPEQAAQAAENANGRVQQDSGSDKPDEITEAAENESQPDDETPAKSNMNSVYLALGAAALIGIGAVGFMLTKKKSKGKSSVSVEPDDEEEILISEDDDFEFYDHNGDDE